METKPVSQQTINMDEIRAYFAGKLLTYGNTPRGVDWNSPQSQEVRFAQLARVIAHPEQPYSLIDYGSGFGSLYDYLHTLGHTVEYYGYDIVETMVTEGRRLHAGQANCKFTANETDLNIADYAIASGIFNIKLDSDYETWTAYVVETITRMDQLSSKGFSFNLLTSYSDPEYMRSDLYYADPCFFFDYCKRHFAKNVAILHDYGLYDFTIIVRKQL